MIIVTKRAYEEPGPDDGHRVLVDRLWPRGVSKDGAKFDEWLRETAPSNELRQWFHHDRTRWAEFRQRYFEELEVHRELLRQWLRRVRTDRITLIYASRDEEHNHAVVLKEYLERLASD